MFPLPVVSCRVLGPAHVMVGGAEAPVELLWRKHLALLVYLARSPRRSRTRDHLLGLLWSDRDEKQARHSLSEALRVLRRVLGDTRVHTSVDQVGLAADAVALDCDEFAELCARGDWTAAAGLVDGEFLEGFAIPEANEFENWLAAERALWRTRALEALVQCAETELARGDVAAAGRAGLGAVRFDPTSEPAARAAMRALALAGDRTGALRLAEDLTRALRATLNAGPTAETARLVERVQEARVGRRLLAAAPTARPRPPLCARADELERLGMAWDRARRERVGQVVLVVGEPGEGKSRLLEELTSRARLDGATVALARAVPADQATPWSAVAGLLVAGLSDAPGLAGAPPAALGALTALDPAVGARFHVTAPATSPATPTGDAFVAAAIAAAGERPLMLALDDAQWTDAASLAALPALARDTARRPVFLLLGVTSGAPAAERFDGLRARLGRDLEGSVVRLRRLDAAALRQLAAWAVPAYGDAELDRLTRRVARDTAGIALLAVAMVEAVAAGFKLAPDAPAWPSPKRTLVDSLPGELPPAVLGTICLRFRELPDPVQHVLAAATTLEDRVHAGELARATGLEVAEVHQALDRLEWERWLLADARGYVFAAPIVRDILLQEMVSPGQARRYRQRRTS